MISLMSWEKLWSHISHNVSLKKWDIIFPLSMYSTWNLDQGKYSSIMKHSNINQWLCQLFFVLLLLLGWEITPTLRLPYKVHCMWISFTSLIRYVSHCWFPSNSHTTIIINFMKKLNLGWRNITYPHLPWTITWSNSTCWVET